jgi:rare lipoprotein A
MRIFIILAFLLTVASARAAICKESSDSGKSPSELDRSNSGFDKEKCGLRSFSGNVSWYGIPFHGHKTASGEIFDMYKLSAAHLSLHLPTRVLVEDPRTGNAVIVKVNDRGPYVKTRVMDLSREAARELGTLPRGVAFVDITVLESSRDARKTQ